jgi:cytosine deaminase
MTHSIHAARLPRWLLPSNWPVGETGPALATIEIAHARIQSIRPETGRPTGTTATDLGGALVLPGLIEAHAHLDKALTRPRLGALQPGLLAAIAAMQGDRHRWTDDDLRERAQRGLEMAKRAGVTHLRTHVDWWGIEPPPAWHVLAELADEWQDRICLERVALVPLPLIQSRDRARAIAAQVKKSDGAALGGFIHTSNHDGLAIDRLIDCAAEAALDLDLHIDEELDPRARGLEHVVRRVRETGHAGRIVCGHACALSARNEADALALLDDVARTATTLIALPFTNLLLQDASGGRTPRRRGLTLLKEARDRGIPVLVASDNVQDAFCPLGVFDPVDALRLAVMAAQLDEPFDIWSQSICRADWLASTPHTKPSLVGLRADLAVFPDTDPTTWPASAARRVLRAADLSWSEA